MIEQTRLMVDGHVHIYDCYPLEKFFTAAISHLDHFYRTLYSNGSPYVKVLLLTEAKSNDYFARWCDKKAFPNDSGYHFLETGETTSLVLAKDGVPQCYVIRGRQIVTRESLEVLAIGTAQSIEDGLHIETVIEKLIENEELGVLAWGVGKWFFKRGKTIKRIMRRYRSPYLMIGDNSGRPTFWPTPRLFKEAAAMNIPDINGSDPLPFEEDYSKVGTFGFTLEGDFDKERPNQSLKELLITPGIDSRIGHFGFRDPLIRFVKRQSRIYTKKYLKKGA